jgi:DNA-binding transcriptional MerR regulator
LVDVPVTGDGDLLPIGEVARMFGLRPSTLRYYEDRGLLTPALWRGRRRWYGPAELRRLAFILFCQRDGMMSLERIGQLVSSSATGEGWRNLVRTRLAELHTELARIHVVVDGLEHALACEHDHPFQSCPVLADLLRQRVDDAAGRPLTSTALESPPSAHGHQPDRDAHPQ